MTRDVATNYWASCIIIGGLLLIIGGLLLFLVWLETFLLTGAMQLTFSLHLDFGLVFIIIGMIFLPFQLIFFSFLTFDSLLS